MTSNRLRPVYTSARWKKVCELVYERDGRSCRLCGTGSDLTCHHTNPAADPYNEDYVVVLCRVCHGKQDGPRAARTRPAGRSRPDRVSRLWSGQ